VKVSGNATYTAVYEVYIEYTAADIIVGLCGFLLRLKR